MIEVSWGELFVVSAVGLALIGRHDLPSAARTAGTQVGRIVGLLQGARARADRFAANNELKQLQNELRSGLRELDAVKSELAVSLSGQGMVGRNLGAMTPGVNKMDTSTTAATVPGAAMAASRSPILLNVPLTSPTLVSSAQASVEPAPSSSSSEIVRELPPVEQTIAAVAEEEWKKQGIGFRSRAEQGSGLQGGAIQQATTGSAILANLYQQTLIFDQYDRVVREQDQALQSKMHVIQDKLQKKQQLQAKKKSKDDEDVQKKN